LAWVIPVTLGGGTGIVLTWMAYSIPVFCDLVLYPHPTFWEQCTINQRAIFAVPGTAIIIVALLGFALAAFRLRGPRRRTVLTLMTIALAMVALATIALTLLGGGFSIG
jgi:hypothetical protein